MGHARDADLDGARPALLGPGVEDDRGGVQVRGRLDLLGIVAEHDEDRVAVGAAAVGRLAAKLGLELDRCARGILAVADAVMERALRRVSVARGHEPADFALVAFGGAGPLHGASLARRLGIPKLVLPPAPGVLSAAGMAEAAPGTERLLSVGRELPAVNAGEARALLARLEVEAAARLGPVVSPRVRRWAEVRYRGQSGVFRIEIEGDWDEGFITAGLHEAHERCYGFRREGEPVELAQLRVRVEGVGDRRLQAGGCRPEAGGASLEGHGEPTGLPADRVAPSSPRKRGSRASLAAPIAMTPVLASADPCDWPVLDREALPPGTTFSGPAILVDATSTGVLGEGDRACVDAHGTIVVDVGSGPVPWTLS